MITFFVNPETQHTFGYMKENHADFPFKVLTYPRLFRKRELPAGTYIFTDLERLDQWEIRVAAEIWKVLNSQPYGYRVLNNPALVKTRYALLRALFTAKINDFNAYRVDELAVPKRYPVFVRREFDHARPLTDLIKDKAELERVIDCLVAEGEPMNGLLITEYSAEPVNETTFRKYGTFRVADRVFPHCCVHEHQWLVKYGVPSAWTEEMANDELVFAKENLFQTELAKAFELANIEFGRVDFGLVEGQPQIYEINTNPYLSFRIKEPKHIRGISVKMAEKAFLEALEAIDMPLDYSNTAILESEALNFIRSKRGSEQMRTYRR